MCLPSFFLAIEQTMVLANNGVKSFTLFRSLFTLLLQITQRGPPNPVAVGETVKRRGGGVGGTTNCYALQLAN